MCNVADYDYTYTLQIKALKDLGLNVIKGIVTSEGPNMRRKKFLVTRQYVTGLLTCLPSTHNCN